MELVDYLLLDYVSEFQTPLHSYFSTEIDLLFNKPHHEIASDLELSKKLAILIKENLISLYYFPLHRKVARFIYLNESEMQMYINSQVEITNTHDLNNKCIYIQLTKKGGHVWEERFQPNWNLYHNISLDNGLFLIQAGSKAFLYNALEIYMQHSPELKNSVDKLFITELKPWQVSHWKVLPTGFQTYFSTNSNNTYTTDELLTWRYQWGKELKDGLLEPNQWLIWREKEIMWSQQYTFLPNC